LAPTPHRTDLDAIEACNENGVAGDIDRRVADIAGIGHEGDGFMRINARDKPFAGGGRLGDDSREGGRKGVGHGSTLPHAAMGVAGCAFEKSTPCRR
jgi:hypothetical protein